jgi:hypothetical protein
VPYGKTQGMKVLVLLSFTLMAMSANADAVSDFTLRAKILPQALQANGYDRIGNLELGAFVSRVERMNVHETQAVHHQEDLDGGIKMERNLAEWHRTSTGDVAVAGPRWMKTPQDIRSLVALHESLGALGYSDNIFSCSGALYILANADARATLKADELTRIEGLARSNCIMAGGTTGVTGGGDDFIAGARIQSLKKGLAAIRAGHDRKQAADELEASLFVDLERNRGFKRQGSIFDPNYKNTKQCLDPQRGAADESTIRVAFQDRPIPQDVHNGWTFDEASNCLLFHGSAVHGWAGYSVLYSSKR